MKFLQNLEQRLSQSLTAMSARERVMVMVATAVVLVAALGSALWYTHQAAKTQQQRATELKGLVNWMQSQAVTLQAQNNSAASANDKIQLAAQQQGLAVSMQQSGEGIQISATHERYATLANFLSQLAQNGLTIEKMQLISNGQQISLTASVL